MATKGLPGRDTGYNISPAPAVCHRRRRRPHAHGPPPTTIKATEGGAVKKPDLSGPLPCLFRPFAANQVLGIVPRGRGGFIGLWAGIPLDPGRLFSSCSRIYGLLCDRPSVVSCCTLRQSGRTHHLRLVIGSWGYICVCVHFDHSGMQKGGSHCDFGVASD